MFVRNWEQNHNLHGLLAKSAKPIIEYHRIPLKSGYEAFVKIQFPPDADFSAKQKYPMLIDVYAGPGSFAGTDRWETTFSTYLVTNRKYIVAQINGRGSGNRGQKLLHEIYRQMGTVEVQDQLEAAEYVLTWMTRAYCFDPINPLTDDLVYVFFCCPVADLFGICIFIENYPSIMNSSIKRISAFGDGAMVDLLLVWHWHKTNRIH